MGALEDQLAAISGKIRLGVFPFKSELANVHQMPLSLNRRNRPGPGAQTLAPLGKIPKIAKAGDRSPAGHGWTFAKGKSGGK